MWTNGKILNLIEDYHSRHCLWDVTSPDFKNRSKRKLAIKSLADEYSVTVAELEKKIHNLKTSFNRERKKITSSGYSPKKSAWFAYQYLQFLQPKNKLKRRSSTNLDEPVNITDDNNQEQQEEEEVVNVDAEREDDSPPVKLPRNPPERAPKHEDSPTLQAVQFMKSISEVVNARDGHSVFGEYVANKMRNCNRPKVEVALAQRYINDVLFKLDVGLLANEIPVIQSSRIEATLSPPPQD